jgi:hypothetical protein
VRDLLKGHDARDCIYQLRLLSTPVRRIAEWIDDWFAPFLRRYTAADVRARLDELGFVDSDPLRAGTVYDTSRRRIDAEETEAKLMGEGDLRFFCTRKSAAGRGEHQLPDPPDRRGSMYVEPSAVTVFAEPLARVRTELEAAERRIGSEGSLYRVAVCSSVHATVRSLLEADAPFDDARLRRHLEELALTLSEFARRA